MADSVYDTYYQLHERLGAGTARDRAVELHAQAISYVWGYQDAGGEVKDTQRSTEFGWAYGVVALRYELSQLGMRPPIQDAWRSWQEHGEIRSWAYGGTQRLDGPSAPVRL